MKVFTKRSVSWWMLEAYLNGELVLRQYLFPPVGVVAKRYATVFSPRPRGSRLVGVYEGGNDQTAIVLWEHDGLVTSMRKWWDNGSVPLKDLYQ